MTGSRVVLFAYHTLGVRCLERLVERGATVAAVVTHEDDPAEPRWFESVAEAARARGLPVLTPRSPNAPPFSAMLRDLAPDLFVSVMYRRLLSPELLAIPKLAAVNLHPSLLPKYRGRAPINWVLVNGETRTGVTLHHMVEEADAGHIIAQEPVEIGPEDTALALFRKIEAVGPELLDRMYPAIVDGTAPRIPQDPAQATTFGRRHPEDGRIAWSSPARRIADMIRAVTHPFPGAFVGDGSDRLHLWAGRALPGDSGDEPGTVLEIAPGEGVVIAAGEGTVMLARVQQAGGLEQRGDVWARERGLAQGARLEAAACAS